MFMGMAAVQEQVVSRPVHPVSNLQRNFIVTNIPPGEWRRVIPITSAECCQASLSSHYLWLR